MSTEKMGKSSGLGRDTGKSGQCAGRVTACPSLLQTGSEEDSGWWEAGQQDQVKGCL